MYGCLLFAFTTDPSFRVSLSDNKDGLLLRIWFYTLPRSFKRIIPPFTVGSECPVSYFAICDPMKLTLCNSKIADLLTMTVLVFMLPFLN